MNDTKLIYLRSREEELVEIIRAIREMVNTEQWSTLKRHVFDGVVEKLEKQLKDEATRPELNQPELYRLQGQLVWAKRYSDMDTLADAFRLELTNVRRQINPPAERDIGS